MKTGDKIKAFVQVGLMKEPRWLQGTLLEGGEVSVYGITNNLGTINVRNSGAFGTKLHLETGKVKLWQPLVDGKLDSFREDGWEDLKRVVADAVGKFFPHDQIRFDDEAPAIYVNHLVVAVGVKEMETIASFREIPVWTVSYFKGIAATRWEPDDVEEVDCGDSSTTIGAARIIVDNLWEYHTEGYWESLNESRFCELEDYGH